MTRSTLATLDEIWQATLPRLTSNEQRAAIALLREVSNGEPVSASRLGQALEVPAAEAERLLTASSLRPFADIGADGRIEGFWGLSTKPTHHRFRIGERTLWTWCAQDSLFLPELLGETARIESSDPETGQAVRLTISPDRVEAAEPEGLTVSMVSADTADLTSAARIIATACHFIFFFANHASGERWVATHPQTMLLSLDDAVALGRRQNVRMFGHELARQARERYRS